MSPPLALAVVDRCYRECAKKAELLQEWSLHDKISSENFAQRPVGMTRAH